MHAIWGGCIKDLPKELYHDSILKDIYGNTVAMHAAFGKCMYNLPRQFYHDPTLKNNDNKTV